MVAFYNEGATELFKAIEECDWESVESICSTDPIQASIYVVSTRTMQTIFQWSIWKRLPLHEIARRHPPVNVFSKLIRAYQAACRSVTHFGELPLHLAVECGASFDVVNVMANVLLEWFVPR